MNTRDKLLPVLIDAIGRPGNEGIVHADLDEGAFGNVVMSITLRDEAAFIELIKALREMPK